LKKKLDQENEAMGSTILGFLRRKKKYPHKPDQLDHWASHTLENLYKHANQLQTKYEKTPEWKAKVAHAEATHLHILKNQVIEQKRLDDLAKAEEEEKKAKKEETLAAVRSSNLEQGIHKPESFNSADAFINALDWEGAELLAGALLRSQGWQIAMTKSGADGGVDAWGNKQGLQAAVQVKDWKHPVSGPTIRESIGAAQAEGVAIVFVITTGRFTSDARETANKYQGQQNSNQCHLWDRNTMKQNLLEMSNADFKNMVLSERGVKTGFRKALDAGHSKDISAYT